MELKTLPITGRTRLYLVIGDPVAQVRAPELMNPIMQSLGRDAVMVSLQIAPEQIDQLLPSLLRSPNLDGILVTIPHKFSAAQHAAKVSPAVEKAGCANALRRTSEGWEAENFDGIGFVQGLSASGFDPAGKRILVVGSGGAGAAIAAAIVDAKPKMIALFDIEHGRSRRLADRLANGTAGVSAIEVLPDAATYDLVVNATPLGLQPGDDLPIAVETLSPGTLVADVIMKPQETALLKKARDMGFGTHLGIHMLDAQIDMYCRFFGLASGIGDDRTIGA
ncbi:hypothetical protein [Fulvimarina sp. MAC3]|uniref:shikimate dehydrogenase family protein n=1 Tax=Fulvimarina sp. MAC3 TaxID=3148887 RepID=UPI0031FBB930